MINFTLLINKLNTWDILLIHNFACFLVQVLLKQVRNPVEKEYLVQQQQSSESSIFSKVLYWLPWEPRQCNLRVQIHHEEYPPCIHMDLKYKKLPVKPDVDTTLKIICKSPNDCMSFKVNVPGEQLIHWTAVAFILCKYVVKWLCLSCASPQCVPDHF